MNIAAANLLIQYLAYFPEEECKLQPLTQLLKKHPAIDDQIRRDNMDGHLTVGGIVIDSSQQNVLLVQHITLGKRLPPGGHIESNDRTPLDSILREIREETGIDSSELRHLPLTTDEALIPIDINIHTIPENQKKRELQHSHHDLRFLFEFVGVDDFPRSSPEVEPSTEQLFSGRIDWCPLQDAFPEPEQCYLANKVRQLLSD